jgi:membrane protease subunit (stomatin/prohibitin family)
MTLREFISGELIDVIEWVDDTDDTMAWRFSRPNNEIKNGAQLIVRQSQVAILVDQGHIADVFMPGRHVLSTSNLPVLSRLQGWKYGFESPFKADVIYLNTRQFIGQKWGTSNPVIVRDAELGPVRLRAFGTYAVRVTEPERFVEELVGTNATFHVDQTTEQLRDLVVTKVSVVLAGGSVSIYELASKYGEIGARVQEQVAPQFQQYGLQIAQLVIENVSLPPEVEATLDQKTRMNMLGDLDRYARLQASEPWSASRSRP